MIVLRFEMLMYYFWSNFCRIAMSMQHKWNFVYYGKLTCWNTSKCGILNRIAPRLKVLCCYFRQNYCRIAMSKELKWNFEHHRKLTYFTTLLPRFETLMYYFWSNFCRIAMSMQLKWNFEHLAKIVLLCCFSLETVDAGVDLRRLVCLVLLTLLLPPL